MRLHLACVHSNFLTSSSSSRAADRTCRLLVYLTISSSLNFSRRLLKQFMDDASTSSWDRLFHLFLARWEKYNRVSQELFFIFFNSFQLCPLIIVPSALSKKSDQGIADSLHSLVNFYQVSPVPSFYQTPQSQLTKSFLVWQTTKVRKQSSKTVLDSFQKQLVFTIVRAPDSWAVIQMRSDHWLVKIQQDFRILVLDCPAYQSQHTIRFWVCFLALSCCF